MGRSSEILRDEVKFSKFVARLRKRFSYMFNDILKTQLLLTNVITPEDWEIMEEHIQYDFLYDNHFAELKDAELFNERLAMVAVAEPYVGKYFSQEYVRRKVLRQTTEEIREQDDLIDQEIKDGVIPDPADMMLDPEGSGGLMPPTPPEEQIMDAPGATDAGTNANTATVDLEIDKPKAKPKGGVI